MAYQKNHPLSKTYITLSLVIVQLACAAVLPETNSSHCVHFKFIIQTLSSATLWRLVHFSLPSGSVRDYQKLELSVLHCIYTEFCDTDCEIGFSQLAFLLYPLLKVVSEF